MNGGVWLNGLSRGLSSCVSEDGQAQLLDTDYLSYPVSARLSFEGIVSSSSATVTA